MTDDRELRLAVAMNGGVSLAVWIGGVAMELQSFIAREGQWGATRKGAGIEQARIDLLAGTSAGGLNAVFLALAQAYDAVDLGELRNMWLRLADFEGDLLRNPSTKDPMSLLDGTYFHDQLHDAITALLANKELSDRPVDLLTTATALHGEVDDVRDDFGDRFPGDRYAVLFHFSARYPGKGDFVTKSAEPAAASRLLAQLALASRSSSSFPFAFEPWYCDPMDPKVFDPAERRRVDIPNARFLVDGGVLDNLPVGRAIDAIFELPAQGPVDRILAAVVPLHQQQSAPDPRRKPDEEADRPRAGAVLSSALLGIPRDENDATTLRAVATNNDAVSARLAARRDLYERPYGKIVAAACAAWPSYRTRAATQSERMTVDTCLEYLSATDQAVRAPSIEALREAMLANAVDGDFQGWPWVPVALESGNWSPPAIRRGAAIVLDLYTMALGAGCRPESWRLREAKRLAHAAIARVTIEYGARPSVDFAIDLGQRLASGATAPKLETAVIEALAPRRTPDARAELSTAFLFLGEAVVEIYDAWSNAAPNTVPGALEDALGGYSLFGQSERGRQLIARLETIQSAFAGMADPSEQKLQLAIMSPSFAAPIDALERTDPQTKLSGDDLAHFGAFLKRSWRANDWLWGRLDAATALGRILELPFDEIVERQSQIVEEEAFYLCDAIVRDHDRGARCVQGRDLFKPDANRPDRIPEWKEWNEWTENSGTNWDAWAGHFLASSDPKDFVKGLRIGEETVKDEITSSLGVRVATQSLATTTKVLEGAGLPGQKFLNGLLKPVSGVAAMAYRYTRGSRRFTRQIALGAATAGAGVLAIADMLNIFRVGALAPILWLVVLGGALVGILRAPFTSLVLGGVVATTGFLYSVKGDTTYVNRNVWRYRPDWIGNRFAALAIIGGAFFLIGSRWLALLDDRWYESHRRASESIGFLQKRFGAVDHPRGRVVARCLAAVAIVGLPIAKWIQLEHFTGRDQFRQIILLATLCVMVGVIAWVQGQTGRAFPAVFGAALVGGPFCFGGVGRWLRVLLGAASVGLATVAYGAAQGWSMIPDWLQRPWLQAALTVAALLPLIALAWWERNRSRAARATGDEPPAHLVLWTVGPGVIVWVALTVLPLARHWHLLQSSQVTQKQFFTIAIGEEVLFRGLLLAILVAAGWDYFSFALVSVGFGLWHVPDVITHVGSDTRVVSALVTFVAMFLVSQLVFVPLRLRSRNVLAPAFVHAAWNISLTSFWSGR